jgi:hypothetical protein
VVQRTQLLYLAALLDGPVEVARVLLSLQLQLGHLREQHGHPRGPVAAVVPGHQGLLHPHHDVQDREGHFPLFEGRLRLAVGVDLLVEPVYVAALEVVDP